MKKKAKLMRGEYKLKGEYHSHLDKKWKYYPIYIQKMRYVRSILNKLPKDAKIIDLGCGEGVLVREYAQKGYNIIGIDYNYSSKYVMEGDIANLKFKNNTFDVVLSLDVLEHLSFEQQEKAVSEIYRILNKKGKAIISVPNLAHFASRISFLFLGNLIRTSSIERHKGDRPIGEYNSLFKKSKFRIIKRKGLFPTYPIISLLTYFLPDKALWLHKIYDNTLSYPNFCFLNIFILKKR